MFAFSKSHITKRQNELYSEVWKLFSQSSADVPAPLPCAMLPSQARELAKNSLQNLLYSSFCSLSDTGREERDIAFLAGPTMI